MGRFDSPYIVLTVFVLTLSEAPGRVGRFDSPYIVLTVFVLTLSEAPGRGEGGQV